MTEGGATLNELLNEPIIRLLMERDRVRPEEIRLLLEQARDRSAEETLVPLPHVIAKTCSQLWLCR